jgi:hypothetical protein
MPPSGALSAPFLRVLSSHSYLKLCPLSTPARRAKGASGEPAKETAVRLRLPYAGNLRRPRFLGYGWDSELPGGAVVVVSVLLISTSTWTWFKGSLGTDLALAQERWRTRVSSYAQKLRLPFSLCSQTPNHTARWNRRGSRASPPTCPFNKHTPRSSRATKGSRAARGLSQGPPGGGVHTGHKTLCLLPWVTSILV